jgi:U3 small nucleolar RNA-associated protein 22
MEGQFERVSFENSLLMKIFRAATSQFDVIITLRKKLNPRACQHVEETNNPMRFQEYKKKVEEMLPVVEFDPVQLYLQELRNTFGHLALFLHDTFGGQYIAVVWKPEIFKASPFTGTNVKGRQLGKKGDSIVVNINGVLETFELLGNGLVEEVKGQSENWKFAE